eukprot:GILK01013642.1.p1 GENE.GILK01013642.1~~GILK01013642.1.p1  ORF type:complete len:341 (-),score=37.84 GILK01013642.1:305-1327(-)
MPEAVHHRLDFESSVVDVLIQSSPACRGTICEEPVSDLQHECSTTNDTSISLPSYEQTDENKQRSFCSNILRVLSGFVVAGSFTALAVIAMSVPSSRTAILNVAQWLQACGLPGAFITIGLLTCTIVACLPSSMFEILIGFIYGPWAGFFVSLIGKQCGCTAAFLVGRHCIRSSLEKWIRSNPKILLLEKGLAAKQTRFLLLVRLMYIPIGLKNYGLSVLRVSFNQYFWCTLISSVPYSIALVYVGSTASDMLLVLDGKAELGSLNIIMMLVGLITIAIGVIWIGIETRRILRESKNQDGLSISTPEINGLIKPLKTTTVLEEPTMLGTPTRRVRLLSDC